MKHINTPKNVSGAERAASVVGGIALLGNGIRTRGPGGLLQMLAGGMVLLRGATGHCQLKQLLASKWRPGPQNTERASHTSLDSDFQGQDSDSTPSNASAGRQAPVIQS